MRHQFEDGGDDYERDLDQRTRGIGGRSGRIILLGDGTEVLTDSDETEMFDHDAEDKDLQSQASKGHFQSSEDEAEVEGQGDSASSEASIKKANPVDVPPPNTSASPVTYIKAASDSALPEKLETPPKHND